MKQFPDVNGNEFHANSINDHGVVAGSALTGPNYDHAYVYDSTTGYSQIPFQGTQSMLEARINNNGTVVGDTGYQCWKWSSEDGLQWLPMVGSYWHQIQAINDQELITAFAVDEVSGFIATSVVWDANNTLFNVGLRYSWDINDSGRLVGTQANPSMAYYWDWGHEPHLLAGGGRPTSINNLGDIVGFKSSPDGSIQWVRKYARDGSSYEDIGFWTGWASTQPRINDRQEVVWVAPGPTSSRRTAMIWTESTGAHELFTLLDSQAQTLQYQITEVLDINNRGQIIAYGYRPGQQSWEGERFLLEPVPEPATLAAFSLGTLALLRRRRVRAQ